MYHAKNLTLRLDDISIDYARFGNGEKTLVMIPGLNLRGVKGAALPLAYMYRAFANDYTIYVFDRRTDVPDGFTVKDIADDTARAMKALGIEKATVFGVSQGGMIAQYLALDYPELVNKLVLAVTLSRTNETVKTVIENWIELAENGKLSSVVLDMMSKMYSDAYLKKYGFMIPLVAKFTKMTDPKRFISLAKACLTCDTYERLGEIKCPAFVIGGSEDKIVTAEASREIAEKLGCELYMCEGYGHAAYEEVKDFNGRVLSFINK